MSVLSDTAEEIKTALVAVGVLSSDHLPARFTPPMALVTQGSPYVQDSETFGQFLVRFDVIATVRVGDNEVANDDLNEIIEDIVVALVNLGYGCEQVSQPYSLDVGNAQYPAATVTVTKNVNF